MRRQLQLFQAIVCIAISVLDLAIVANGQSVCACTTPDCTLSGTDICKAREFCYSRVRAASGTSAQPIEKGCIGSWRAERVCRDSPVSLIDGDTYQVCCSGPWCNGIPLERLPQLQLSTARSLHDDSGKADATQTTPSLATETDSQLHESARQPQKPKASSSVPASSALASPSSSSSLSESESASRAAAAVGKAVSPTEAAPASLSSKSSGDSGPQQPLSVLREATPWPSQSVHRSSGSYPLDTGVSDLVHPVYIAVPVMSLCLIVTALAALVLVIRRREQLECPPEQRQQQRQQPQQQQQQQQYSMYYRNSLLTPEPRRSHPAHLFSWCPQPEQSPPQTLQQSQPQCRRPLLACNGVGPDPSCHSQLNDLA